MAAFFCFHFAQALEQDADGYYLIHNAQELVEYRDSVNNRIGYNGRLAADIDLSSVCGIIDGKEVNWIPISCNGFNNYFDGANHTISNLYINSNEDGQALFETASISNLTVDKAFVKGEYFVAGIAIVGILQNCHFNGIVIGNYDVGGIAANGKCGSYINCSNYGLIVAKRSAAGITPWGDVSNCYNQGRVISFDEDAGGIVNRSGGYLVNCYNSGEIIGGNNAGGILPENNSYFKSCYSLDGATISNTIDTFVVDSASFLNGTILDSLNNFVNTNSIAIPLCADTVPLLPWVQTIGVDSFPRFETVNLKPTEEFIVRFNGALDTLMVTKNKKFELPVCSDSTYEYVFEYGFDGKNIVSDTTVNVSKVLINALTKDEDGFYLIHNGKELSHFRDLVNSGNNEINARLTNDIDMSEETAKDSSWVGIGIYDYRNDIYKSYNGIFDGMGYTISNVYQNTVVPNGGLFGYMENSSIRNVEIKNSFFSGQGVGSFVGYAENSSIINCGTEANIYGYSDYPACGILSKGKDSEIINCFSISKVFGQYNSYGISGHDCNNCTIANCYSSSKINSGLSVSAFDYPYEDSVQHCFYDSTLFFSSLNEEEYIEPTTAALPVTTERIKSSDFLDEMNAWVDSMNAIQDTIVYAKWVRDEKDGYPKFNPMIVEYTVHFTGALDTLMVTKNKKIELPVCSDSTYEYAFENGFDGKNIVSDTTVKVSIKNTLTKDEDGFYLIHNGKELSHFRDLVNSGNKMINARLTNDIDMSEETAKDSSWISIGHYEYDDSSSPYSGIFDGMGHSISHLYQVSKIQCGLFGDLRNAVIKNIEFKNSYIACGRSSNSNPFFAAAPFADSAGETSFINCGTDVEMSSEMSCMGFVRSSGGCKFENCYVIGNLTANSTVYGLYGIRGSDNVIRNFYISCKMNVLEGGEMCAVSPFRQRHTILFKPISSSTVKIFNNTKHDGVL